MLPTRNLRTQRCRATTKDCVAEFRSESRYAKKMRIKANLPRAPNTFLNTRYTNWRILAYVNSERAELTVETWGNWSG